MMIYTPDDYNDDNVLKIPFSLYVVLLYSIKYYIYIISILAGARGSTALKGYASGMDANILLLVATLPAIAVIISAVKRYPYASQIFRLVWSGGRYLLSLTLALNAILLFSIAYTTMYGKNNFLYVLSFFDVWFIFYLNFTHKLRDVFNEFPDARK